MNRNKRRGERFRNHVHLLSKEEYAKKRWCEQKQPFISECVASTKAVELRNLYGVHHSVFKCKWCKQYHIMHEAF